jgi:Na+/phosphate symporter
MAASLLNHTLSLTVTTNLTTTSTSLPISTNQPPEWDAVAVYGLVFGLLAVLLAVPGAYLAIVALKRHREHEARQRGLMYMI